MDCCISRQGHVEVISSISHCSETNVLFNGPIHTLDENQPSQPHRNCFVIMFEMSRGECWDMHARGAHRHQATGCVYTQKTNSTTLPHTVNCRLYFGTVLCGERCEGLEGLDGVDFAVNLQSLCTLTAASLIICGGTPITVENQGWEGQEIYHSSPPTPALRSSTVILHPPKVRGGFISSHSRWLS